MKTAVALAAALVLFPSACSSRAPAPMITQSGDLGITVQYVPDPPAPGIESITVGVHDLANKPVEGANVEVHTTMGAMSMSGQSVIARPEGNGLYATAVELGAGGRWEFTVAARAGDRMGMAHVAVDVR